MVLGWIIIGRARRYVDPVLRFRLYDFFLAGRRPRPYVFLRRPYFGMMDRD